VVHYDFKRDHATAPDRYQSIPDSRSVVTRSDGRGGQRSLNVAFQILEIDTVTEETRATIGEVSALATQLAGLAGALPFLQTLSPALNVAGRLGESALRAYAKSDRVISIDMSFAILKRGAASLQRSGDFLRYGYFFFLSRPLDVKLYAATRSSKHVRLMMRTSAGRFVPLKHVSYLVVKVGVPFEDLCKAKPTLGAHHARRLQDVCENVDSMTSKEVKEEIGAIMAELNGLAGSVPASAGVLNPGAAAAADVDVGNTGEQVGEVLQ
jgi:hypothetical protein